MKRWILVSLSWSFLSCAHGAMNREHGLAHSSVCARPDGRVGEVWSPDIREFSAFDISYDGDRKTVYQYGEGPGVLILHEIYGLSPETLCLAKRIAEQGYSVFLPHFFGTPGKRAGGLATVPVCLGRDFNCFSKRSSRVTQWLRALVPEIAKRSSGDSIAVIGMCLTGSFPLVLMQDPLVKVAVLSQPSLPFGVTPAMKSSLGIGESDLSVAKERSKFVQLLAMRFEGDMISPEEKFQALIDAFGNEIDTEEFPPGARRNAHALLTSSFEPKALGKVLEALRQELKP